MSRHDDQTNISDMLGHAREAVDMLGNDSLEVFGKDRVKQLAVTRLIEIIGEAANRVSPEMRRKNPGIAWQAIIGMRNRLIHGYDVIDYDLLWNTVIHDLPLLITSLEELDTQ